MFNIQGHGKQHETINNIIINNGAKQPLETGLQKLQSCTVCGRGGAVVCWEPIVVALALHSHCVSLSHCTLLASCTAEEAPQRTEAVHHHQSLCTLCACVCVCVSCLPVSHEALQTPEQQSNTLRQQQRLLELPSVPK